MRFKTTLTIEFWRYAGTPLVVGPLGEKHRRIERLYCTYVEYVRMPNKTISIPDDVVPLIENLGVPFSTWVTNQLRLHAATQVGASLSQQFLADAVLAGTKPPSAAESLQAMKRMERSAPW